MKRCSMFFGLCTLLVIIFFSFSAAQTADTWRWLNPKPTGSQLYAVRFIDNDTGYAVGTATILKTTDGGATWEYLNPIPFELCNNPRSLSFPEDAQTGYVVGKEGHIIKTTDGGATWHNQSSGTTQRLNSVQFPIDAQTGYIAGTEGTILKTTNGGATWQSQPIGTTYDLIAMHFPEDDQTGYVLDDNHANVGVWKTTDAGASWVCQGTIQALTSSDMHFVDEHTGYISGQDGTIQKTTDGGTNWIRWPTPTGGSPKCIQFTDTQTGYFGNGGIYKTTDAGETWSYLEGTIGECTSLHFPVDGQGQIGYTCHTGGRIYKTTDAGATWTSQSTPTNVKLCSIYFIDANTGYAVGTCCTGYAVILKTTNGGATWSLQASGSPYYLYSVWFPQDANTGYIAGAFGYILKTTNGGSTWVRREISGGQHFNSICFTRENPAIGYLVGKKSMILRLGDIIGIEEEQVNISIQASDTRLNITPNPFMSYATVHGYEKENFALYDISGRLVSTCRGDRIGEGLCAGVYFVIPANKNLKPVRIVKVR